jgi:hypothetical protein
MGHKEANAKWYAANKAREITKNRKWKAENAKRYGQTMRTWALGVKVEVFTQYGPNREVRCSWVGCTITDLDMLSLDHISDNGAEERKRGQPSGKNLYRKLKKEGFPTGFQTLCMNHQHKKMQMRERGEI